MKRIQIFVASLVLFAYSVLSFAFDAKAMLDSLPKQATVVPSPAKAAIEPTDVGATPASETELPGSIIKPKMLKFGLTEIPVAKTGSTKPSGASSTKATTAKPTAAPKSNAESPPMAPPLDPAVIARRRGDMDSLVTVYDSLINKCDGRYGVLESRLRQQTIRAESISMYGGLIGVLGAVATCPHCSALASGLAGLANPLQQTFKENSDTPADTIAELKSLSDSIKTDFNAYQMLPAPQVYSGTDDDFSSKWQARRDKLVAITLSCQFFARSAITAGEAPPPAAAPKSDDAAPATTQQ